MPGPRHEARACAAKATRPDSPSADASLATPKAGNEVLWVATKPEEANDSPLRWHDARRSRSKARAAALRDLFRGLRAGDLESVLLTVAMAAEENRMPSADPDEAARILGFLARLVEHDTGLPPPPDGSGSGPACLSDGTDAWDGAPTR